MWVGVSDGEDEVVGVLVCVFVGECDGVNEPYEETAMSEKFANEEWENEKRSQDGTT